MNLTVIDPYDKKPCNTQMREEGATLGDITHEDLERRQFVDTGSSMGNFERPIEDNLAPDFTSAMRLTPYANGWRLTIRNTNDGQHDDGELPRLIVWLSDLDEFLNWYFKKGSTCG